MQLHRAPAEISFTESQNHRTIRVGRDLCGSSSPTTLPKHKQAAQDLVQAGLEYLQRRRLHSLPGQPVPGLPHPQSALQCVVVVVSSAMLGLTSSPAAPFALAGSTSAFSRP